MSYSFPSNTVWYKQPSFRYAGLVAIFILAIFSFGSISNVSLVNRNSGKKSFRGGGYPANKNPAVEITSTNNLPTSFDIAVVADLDKKSKVVDSKKPKFQSFFRRGKLKRSRNSNNVLDTYSVDWDPTATTIYTKMNEGGRGFELSELKWFNGDLLSFDDRTGIVYSLKNFFPPSIPADKKVLKMKANPQYIVMEGDGDSGKGQKHEWATVKDNELFIGSIGKEFTDDKGNIVNKNNFWVAAIGQSGKVRHINWEENYLKIRKALGCEYPGYVIHEAIEWSNVHRKWFILPRRVSKEKYNDMLDEKKGANKMLIASEDFSQIVVRDMGPLIPERGFSSFKFIPNSGDTIILAIKSVENEEKQTQTSFITVLDLDGNVLMKETEIPGNRKFEGVAFLHDGMKK